MIYIPTTPSKKISMSVTEVKSAALGTLAVGTGILAAGPTMTRGGRLNSIRGGFSIHGLTPGDGPHVLYLTAKSLDLAQIQAYLDIEGPVTPDSVASSELASRGSQIRFLGLLVPRGAGSVASLELMNKSLSGLKFTEEAAGWQYCLVNIGKAMTTGATWVTHAQLFVEFNPSG